MFRIIKRIFNLISDALYQEKQSPVTERQQQELEFLPAPVEILESPPSKFARFLMLVICTILITTVAIAWFSFIDIDATAEGKIIPLGKVKLIQSLNIGKVDAIYVHEGQAVQTDDLLIKLNPTESEADSLQVEAALVSQELTMGRIFMLLDIINAGDSLDNKRLTQDLREWFIQHPDKLSGAPEPGQWELHQKQLTSDLAYFYSSDKAFRDTLEQRKAVIQAIRAEITRLEVMKPLHDEHEKNINNLMAKHHASRLEWLGIKEKQVDTRQKLVIEKNRLAEATAALSSAASDRERFQQEFRHTRINTLNEQADKVTELRLTLTKAMEREANSYIKAPVDGIVHELKTNTIGGIVQPAEPLMIIVPKEADLQVEAMILNKDIGFVREGMTADIKIEAFPYTFYGYLKGTIVHISKDAIENPVHGFVYSSLISLDQQNVIINGMANKLQVGMAVTAELNTGKRRLIEFFLEPFLRYRDEAMNVR